MANDLSRVLLKCCTAVGKSSGITREFTHVPKIDVNRFFFTLVFLQVQLQNPQITITFYGMRIFN